METIVKFKDIKDSELQIIVYKTAFKIKNELKISDEEFQKVLEYYNYITNNQTTIDNIIRRNELSLREFKALRLLLRLNEFARKKNVDIVSITTLLNSVQI
jgi:hypothetical protein